MHRSRQSFISDIVAGLGFAASPWLDASLVVDTEKLSLQNLDDTLGTQSCLSDRRSLPSGAESHPWCAR